MNPSLNPSIMDDIDFDDSVSHFSSRKKVLPPKFKGPSSDFFLSDSVGTVIDEDAKSIIRKSRKKPSMSIIEEDDGTEIPFNKPAPRSKQSKSSRAETEKRAQLMLMNKSKGFFPDQWELYDEKTIVRPSTGSFDTVLFPHEAKHLQNLVIDKTLEKSSALNSIQKKLSDAKRATKLLQNSVKPNWEQYARVTPRKGENKHGIDVLKKVEKVLFGDQPAVMRMKGKGTILLRTHKKDKNGRPIKTNPKIYKGKDKLLYELSKMIRLFNRYTTTTKKITKLSNRYKHHQDNPSAARAFATRRFLSYRKRLIRKVATHAGKIDINGRILHEELNRNDFEKYKNLLKKKHSIIVQRIHSRRKDNDELELKAEESNWDNTRMDVEIEKKHLRIDQQILQRDKLLEKQLGEIKMFTPTDNEMEREGISLVNSGKFLNAQLKQGELLTGNLKEEDVFDFERILDGKANNFPLFMLEGLGGTDIDKSDGGSGMNPMMLMALSSGGGAKGLTSGLTSNTSVITLLRRIVQADISDEEVQKATKAFFFYLTMKSSQHSGLNEKTVPFWMIQSMITGEKGTDSSMQNMMLMQFLQKKTGKDRFKKSDTIPWEYIYLFDKEGGGGEKKGEMDTLMKLMMFSQGSKNLNPIFLQKMLSGDDADSDQNSLLLYSMMSGKKSGNSGGDLGNMLLMNSVMGGGGLSKPRENETEDQKRDREFADLSIIGGMTGGFGGKAGKKISKILPMMSIMNRRNTSNNPNSMRDLFFLQTLGGGGGVNNTMRDMMVIDTLSNVGGDRASDVGSRVSSASKPKDNLMNTLVAASVIGGGGGLFGGGDAGNGKKKKKGGAGLTSNAAMVLASLGAMNSREEQGINPLLPIMMNAGNLGKKSSKKSSNMDENMMANMALGDGFKLSIKPVMFSNTKVSSRFDLQLLKTLQQLYIAFQQKNYDSIRRFARKFNNQMTLKIGAAMVYKAGKENNMALLMLARDYLLKSDSEKARSFVKSSDLVGDIELLFGSNVYEYLPPTSGLDKFIPLGSYTGGGISDLLSEISGGGGPDNNPRDNLSVIASSRISKQNEQTRRNLENPGPFEGPPGGGGGPPPDDGPSGGGGYGVGRDSVIGGGSRPASNRSPSTVGSRAPSAGGSRAPSAGGKKFSNVDLLDLGGQSVMSSNLLDLPNVYDTSSYSDLFTGNETVISARPAENTPAKNLLQQRVSFDDDGDGGIRPVFNNPPTTKVYNY